MLTLSLIDVQERRSYPLHIQQLLPSTKGEANTVAVPKRRRGCPKSGKNHVKPEPVLSPILVLLQAMLATILAPITTLQVNHIVLDGKFGNYPGTWTVRQGGLHLISKMRHDAALYRAVDSSGNTLNFLLSATRSTRAAKRFFRKLLGQSPVSQARVINTDQNAAYPSAIAALKAENVIADDCQHRVCKYLNNCIEQDHRFIKRMTFAHRIKSSKRSLDWRLNS